MSDASKLSNGLMATTAGPECWFLGVRGRNLYGCHRQGQAGSGRGAATVSRQRLVLTVVVIVRWSWNLEVSFIKFEMVCTSDEFL